MTCSSSAVLKLARGQGHNKWDPSIKKRTAQSSLVSLNALRTAHSHTDTLLWNHKSCPSATPQHTYVSLHVGETKAIPSSFSHLTSPPSTTETDSLCIPREATACIQGQLSHTSSGKSPLFSGQNVTEMYYFSLALKRMLLSQKTRYSLRQVALQQKETTSACGRSLQYKS